jgi:hypothetical protein
MLMEEGSDVSNVNILLTCIQGADLRPSSITVPSSNVKSITSICVEPTSPLNVPGVPDHVAVCCITNDTRETGESVILTDNEAGITLGYPEISALMRVVPTATPAITLSALTVACPGLEEDMDIPCSA